MEHELDWNLLIGSLPLIYTKYNEYNGCWYHIVRSQFDLFMLEEPYHSLSLLVNLDSTEYIFRILGTTRERGYFSSLDDLRSIVQSKFHNTVACVGNPRLTKGSQGAVVIEQPFMMTVSAECQSYYVTRPGEEIMQGRGRCPQCAATQVSALRSDLDPDWADTSGRRSRDSSNTDEDMKIIKEADIETSIPGNIAPNTVLKRKRGRPKKIIPPEKLIKRKTLSDYTKRKIAENNKKFSVCKLCQRQCRGFRGLVDHMHRDHSDYKPWQCTYCDHKTAFVKTLYRHLKQVHKVNECPCPKCGKTYSRAQSMLFHFTKHEEEERGGGEQTWECGDCGAKFRTKERMEKHIGKLHGGPLECQHCARAFSDSTKLSEHLRTHTGERPFQCTQCGLTFSFQSTLSTHRKTHLREENVSEEEANMRLNYVCEVCGKNFRSNGALKTHKHHVHDGIYEELPCDVCGKSFRTRELLKQHQEREHSDSPKYVCETCGQRFGNSYHLRRHETIHTDHEFPCAFCSRRFKRKDGLVSHMVTIHDNQHHDNHQHDNDKDKANNDDLEKMNVTNTLSEFMGLRPVEDEVDYFESTVSELRIIDPFKSPQNLVIPDPLIHHHHLSHHHPEPLNDQDIRLQHQTDSNQMEVISQIENLSQYKSTVTTSVRELQLYDQEAVSAAEAVFPAVDLTMYEPPASVSVSVSAPQYEVQVSRAEATFYLDQEARKPPVSEYSTYVRAPAPTMRQSVIRLNQKIRVSKL